MPKRKKSSRFEKIHKLLMQNKYVAFAVLPLVFYFIFFCFYSWPWIYHFNTWFFTDQGDGYQNVWNMWWINESVTKLHQLPWHTTLLHYPYGTSLVAQTLNPFNGFTAIGLMKVFNIVQAYNIMVIFSFVFGGTTAFWLCYYFTKRYTPSLIGGFIFTFSSYHFAHAIGHMQLVSLEWVPLFIMFWWMLLKTPRYRTAVGAAVALSLVLLCDYYYFLFCVSVAGLSLAYLWYTKEIPSIRLKSTYRPFLAFIVIAIFIVAPLPLALLHLNHTDPLIGAHNDRDFSVDPGTIFIDGGFWKFSHLTNLYWRGVPTYIAESSIYLTISVIGVSIWAFMKRKKLPAVTMFWLGVALIFIICSLGPRPVIRGNPIEHIPLPYAFLERIIPQLRLSGDPDRIIMMSTLALAIVVAIALSRLNLGLRKHRIFLGLFFVVLVLELWPNTLPMNVAKAYPKYVTALAKLPRGAVLDNGALSGAEQLYHQTIFNKPIALGYISRVPTSVDKNDNGFLQAIGQNRYDQLCSVYKLRYISTPIERPLNTNLPIIYKDNQTIIYDIKSSPNC